MLIRQKFFIRSAKTLVFSSAGFEPARSDCKSEKVVNAVHYLENIVQNKLNYD